MNPIEKMKRLYNKMYSINQVSNMIVDDQLFWESLPRLIAPSIIEEYEEYVKVNRETFVKCIIIGVPPTNDVSGYPQDMNERVIDELLEISAEGYTIGYSFTIIPIENIKAMKMLDEAIYKNKVSQQSYRKDSKGNDKIYKNVLAQPPLKKIFEEEDFIQNYRHVYKNDQKMFHTAFIIIIWAKTYDELSEAESHVRTVLEANRINYEYPICRQLDTFIAAQPYPFWEDFTWAELFSKDVAKLMITRNPNSRTGETGLYFGDDLKTGKNILFDLTMLAAQHLMFVGRTGSGKTFTLLMLLMRAYDMLGKRIVYINPKADVLTNAKAVAEYYGNSATVIDIGEKGKNINPLEILIDKNIESSSYNIRTFDNHSELLHKFFEVLFEGTMSPNMASYINRSLIQVYKQKGILRENPKTWKNAKWPTLLDLRKIWIEDSKDPREVSAKACVDKTYMIETSWSYMNQPTNIDISSDFIIIDISDVPSSIQEAMNVFVTGLMGIRFRTDAKKETIIAIDEAAVFLRSPRLSQFLLKTLTQGRSFKIAIWISTQQTGDFAKYGTSEEFQTNTEISIVMGNMRPDSINHVKEFYKLNENDISNLLSCGVGEGLIIIGDQVIPTKFTPSQHEMDIIKGQLKSQSLDDSESSKLSDSLELELVNENLIKLISQNEVYFKDWFKPNADLRILSKYGYELRTPYKGVGQGNVTMWIKSEKIQKSQNSQKEKIGNQSFEHFSTVLHIAGYLIMLGFDVTINHHGNVDIVAVLNEKTLAIEVEMPGSHSESELIDKKAFAEQNYDTVLFVGTSFNEKQLITAVGQNSVQRRGEILKKWIDDYVINNTNNEKENTNALDMNESDINDSDSNINNKNENTNNSNSNVNNENEIVNNNIPVILS